MQLVNHGIPVELLERVKKVGEECFKLEREEVFNKSRVVNLLNEFVESNKNGKVENVDWEDVFLLTDDNCNQWPSKTPQFK